jgi:hypothetical protein
MKPVRDDQAVAGPVAPGEAAPLQRVSSAPDAQPKESLTRRLVSVLAPPLAVAALFIGV